MPVGAFDDSRRRGAEPHYAADFRAYGYEPVQPASGEDALADWVEQVTPLVPLVQETIDRHTRIGQLHRMARRVHTVEGWLETGAARRVGHSRSPVLTNLEDQADFNVRWAWAEERPRPASPPVVRAKNEERALPWVLPPLLRAAERVVLIDNGSTDRTLEVGASGGRGGRREPARDPLLPVLGGALRRGASRDAGHLAAQPRLLLQLVVLTRAHPTRSSGTPTWC